ncbi:MAG: hypothetical protein IJW45_03625 [Oscillospiraceae bacterium]|nr:hypothetical protein [Oscillospiraceae bacterium]
MPIILIGWPLVVAAVAAILRKSVRGRLERDCVSAWWIFGAGVLTCWGGQHLAYFDIFDGYYESEEAFLAGYYLFRGLGLILLVAGLILVPVTAGKLLGQLKARIAALEEKQAPPVQRGPAFSQKDVPAWKRVQQDDP